VGEEHILVRHRDDVVVERPGRDRFFRLADEQGAVGIELVEAGDCAARLDMLPSREGAAALAVDEHLHSRRIVRADEAHVVRSALVSEGGGDGGVDRKMSFVGEGEPQLRKRRRPFMASMRHRAQVRHGEVALSVRRIGRGRHRGGIGGPHG
jgi:hypothetical protein